MLCHRVAAWSAYFSIALRRTHRGFLSRVLCRLLSSFMSMLHAGCTVSCQKSMCCTVSQVSAGRCESTDRISGDNGRWKLRQYNRRVSSSHGDLSGISSKSSRPQPATSMPNDSCSLIVFAEPRMTDDGYLAVC